ncbi:MAG: endopeptidase La [Clostridia bacterium]|nr:endopeptidase La [Clostridia bacterium]
MPEYVEKIDFVTLPLLPLRGIVAFPAIPVSIELSIDCDILTAEYAEKHGGNIFLCAQKVVSDENSVSQDDLYSVGTVCRIKQFLKLPEGNARIVLECTSRATVLRIEEKDGMLFADAFCKTVTISEASSAIRALMREVENNYEEFCNYLPKPSGDLDVTLKSIKDPSIYADFIAFNFLIEYKDKQLILEEYDPKKRLELLCVIMGKELRVLSTEFNIHKKVRQQIENNQREYYLREQLKVIQDELGEETDDTEIDEYDDAICKANLPDYVEEKLIKEVKKLAKTPYTSADAAVIRNYLDVCLEIPWKKLSVDRIDIGKARKILDADHDGLEKIKERILEYLAVKKLNPKANDQIICLVGPPGTGKTSICESIARAMNRKYVRVCLGGIRDEADIRGHRRTYVASMPGRIINAVTQAGVRNPLILLDEIDKLSRDGHGDPASALLEVLDSEQNCRFRDHFVEMPLDLSDCIFIATANDMAGIPEPLIDRMEIIKLDIYNRYQKLRIAKKHLIKKQRVANGLKPSQITFTDKAIFEIIDFYTAEAGVRSLNREIGNICRKTAIDIVEGKIEKRKVTEETVRELLGIRKILPEKISDEDETGAVNGLAYTSLGGDMLKVEVCAMKGEGKLELTGSLGDVMKESARAAVSYIRAHSDELGVPENFYKIYDLHIHVPEGAVPKDGPSAGITLITAIVSELSKTPVRRDVAMTGEITLRGKLLAIGGLKEKTMAAFKAGVKTVIIPKDNEKDLEDIDPVVREGLEFRPCGTVSEALEISLVK